MAQEKFQVGESVRDPERPKWGVGRIVEDRTFARSPTVGQRLAIDWQGRGVVTILTATRSLERVDVSSPD